MGNKHTKALNIFNELYNEYIQIKFTILKYPNSNICFVCHENVFCYDLYYYRFEKYDSLNVIICNKCINSKEKNERLLKFRKLNNLIKLRRIN